MNRRLVGFLQLVPSNQESAFDEFTIQHLAVYPDRYSCRPYGWKTWLIKARQRGKLETVSSSEIETSVAVTFRMLSVNSVGFETHR